MHEPKWAERICPHSVLHFPSEFGTFAGCSDGNHRQVLSWQSEESKIICFLEWELKSQPPRIQIDFFYIFLITLFHCAKIRVLWYCFDFSVYNNYQTFQSKKNMNYFIPLSGNRTHNHRVSIAHLRHDGLNTVYFNFHFKLTKLIVTMSSYCWCLCPFFFFPWGVLTAAAAACLGGAVFAAPFCADGLTGVLGPPFVDAPAWHAFKTGRY